MDPILFVSTLMASMQAIQTWFQLRDSRRAAAVYKDTFERAQRDPVVQRQAANILVIMPQQTFDILVERTKRCFKFLDQALGHPTEYGDKQIDDEMNALKACVCRELQRIRMLNRDVLPEGELMNWWNAYCKPGGGAIEGIVEIGSIDKTKRTVPA